MKCSQTNDESLYFFTTLRGYDVNGPGIYYDTPMMQQHYHSTCWAAVSEGLSKYFESTASKKLKKDSSSQFSQVELVNRLGKEECDPAKYISMIYDKDVKACVIDKSRKFNQTKMLTLLKSSGGPLVFAVPQVKGSRDCSKLHYILIDGYIRNSSDKYYYVIVKDPYPPESQKNFLVDKPVEPIAINMSDFIDKMCGFLYTDDMDVVC